MKTETILNDQYTSSSFMLKQKVVYYLDKYCKTKHFHRFFTEVVHWFISIKGHNSIKNIKTNYEKIDIFHQPYINLLCIGDSF